MFEDDRSLIQAWLHGRPRNTQKAYQKDIQQFMGYVQIPLAAVRLQDLQQFINHLLNQKHKPASIQRKGTAIKSLYQFAHKQNYVRVNPAIALKLPKVNIRLAGRILTLDEVKAICSAPKNPQHQLFLKFLYATGCRISEGCNLRWSDFDPQPSGQIQVTIIGKRDKLRSVVIPAGLWQQLQTLRTDRESVFGFGVDTADKMIRKATRTAGIEKKVSCHWFRHAHASHALHNAAPVSLVRDTLGHANIATTNFYLESFPNESSSSYVEAI